jgi:Glycosyl transferase family 2
MENDFKSDLAPLVIFAYNRPHHFTQVWNSLIKCPELINTDVYIYADGPKNHASIDELIAIKKTREILHQISGSKLLKLNLCETNQGLANSIINGVSEILAKYDKIIVLEDDVVVSPLFLTYMNAALTFYKNKYLVGCVHSYSYPIKNLPVFYFQRGADCWGWGTWKRSWSLFSKDSNMLLNQLKERNLINDFDYGGTYLFSDMLQKHIEGKNNSWAIRWHASLFLHNMLTLYPGKSFVQNIGNDNSGTHSGSTSMYSHKILNEMNNFEFNEIPIEHNLEVAYKIAKWFKCRNSFFKNSLQIIRTKIKAL